MKQGVAYYRVSTDKQGKSGLGLEAQQVAVVGYCKLNEVELIHEIAEVKSTRKSREGLFSALDYCRLHQAVLVVARLDRLGRDVEQIAGIIKSEVEIAVADNPRATRFTIHILAAVAEEQRQRISETTKAALAAAKKKGVVLGKNGKTLAEGNKKAAEQFAIQLVPIITRLRNRGITSARAMSVELNRRGVPTFRNCGVWYPNTVYGVLNRLKLSQIDS